MEQSISDKINTLALIAAEYDKFPWSARIAAELVRQGITEDQWWEWCRKNKIGQVEVGDKIHCLTESSKIQITNYIRAIYHGYGPKLEEIPKP